MAKCKKTKKGQLILTKNEIVFYEKNGKINKSKNIILQMKTKIGTKLDRLNRIQSGGF